MLAYPRCPACGGELPLKEFFDVWDPASKHSQQVANPALECPSCLAPLRPKQWRAFLLMIAAMFASIGLMAAGMKVFQRNGLASIVTVIAFVGSWFWIQYSLVRRLVSWRVAEPGEKLDFMLPPRAQRLKLEAEMRAEAEAERAAAALEAADYPPWNCLSCGEENPGRFEMCWKCSPAESSDRT